MKVCISGPAKGLETIELYEKVADRLCSAGHDITNEIQEGKIKFNQLEDVAGADVLVARIGTYDDAMWACIGAARAGDIPIVPLWNEGYILESCYGFTKDIKDRNMPLVRKEGDARPWPSATKEGALDFNGLVEDLKILSGSESGKKQRPDPKQTNLELPPYIIGDSRNLENHWSYYKIDSEFEEAGIEVINPSRHLDNYNIDKFPGIIQPDPKEDAVQWCVDAAGKNSSMVIGWVHRRGLLGSRFEEGVAWWNGHPMLYLNWYVFPKKCPSELYAEGRKPEMHLKSVFDQNKEVWGIEKHVGREVKDLVPVIRELREKYRERIKNAG
jgi:hypothetical protein